MGYKGKGTRSSGQVVIGQAILRYGILGQMEVRLVGATFSGVLGQEVRK